MSHTAFNQKAGSLLINQTMAAMGNICVYLANERTKIHAEMEIEESPELKNRLLTTLNLEVLISNLGHKIKDTDMSVFGEIAYANNQRSIYKLFQDDDMAAQILDLNRLYELLKYEEQRKDFIADSTMIADSTPSQDTGNVVSLHRE